MSKEDLPRLMTRKEVAEYLGVAEGTLKNWSSAGTGPVTVKYGRNSVMYLAEDVHDWVIQQRG